MYQLFHPQTRNPKIITKWRLITLFNVSYKTPAKALAIEVKHIFPKTIFLKKMSFLRGWFILDNIIAIWEGMDAPNA